MLESDRSRNQKEKKITRWPSGTSADFVADVGATYLVVRSCRCRDTKYNVYTYVSGWKANMHAIMPCLNIYVSTYVEWSHWVVGETHMARPDPTPAVQLNSWNLSSQQHVPCMYAKCKLFSLCSYLLFSRSLNEMSTYICSCVVAVCDLSSGWRF